jgi:LmbE family N-acetylglucosaminyl deacetylase
VSDLNPQYFWTGVLGILAIGIGLVVALSELQGHHPTSYSYAYSFGQDAHRSQVRLTESSVQLPEISCSWDTALLGMEVFPTWRVSASEAYIDLFAKGEHVGRQYLDPSAEGWKYLNLSTIAGTSSGSVVELRGKRVSWKEQEAEFIAFCNPPLAGKRILVVAPHPDDAEIAAFGLYHQFSKNAHIVTITTGDAGENHYDLLYEAPKEAYRIKGHLRLWNSLTIPLLGDVPFKQMVNLAYPDEKLPLMYADSSASFGPRFVEIDDLDRYRSHNTAPLRPRSGMTWTALVQDLKDLLYQIDPDVIVTPHPVLDKHPDHKFSTIAVLEAAQKIPERTRQFWLYTNHPPTTDFYPFGPRDGLVSLPPVPPRQEVTVDRVHSVPLSADAQRLKLLALEAMHDLRRNRLPMLPPTPHSLSAWREIAVETVWPLVRYGLQMGNTTYFRRAPRPNELFFVYSQEKMAALNSRMLASPAGDAPVLLQASDRSRDPDGRTSVPTIPK